MILILLNKKWTSDFHGRLILLGGGSDFSQIRSVFILNSALESSMFSYSICLVYWVESNQTKEKNCEWAKSSFTIVTFVFDSVCFWLRSMIWQVTEFIFRETFNNEERLVEVCKMFALVNKHIVMSLSSGTKCELLAALEKFNKKDHLVTVRQIIDPKSPPICNSYLNEKCLVNFNSFL